MVKPRKKQIKLQNKIVEQKLPEKRTSFFKAAHYKLAFPIVFLFAVILYSNSINNQYALDDVVVIYNNTFTKQGVAGIDELLFNDTFLGYIGKKKNLVAGGRYRPLTPIMFAVEVELFGENPLVGHIITVFFYGLTALMLYIVLSTLFDTKYKWLKDRWFLSLPFICTLLYIAHPLHSEAVANIKGRDEIITFLGALAAWYFTLKYLELRQAKYLIYNFFIFFLALMAKENAITFLAIIPLSVYFFTDHKIKANLVSIIPLILASAVFLSLRQVILGSPTADTIPNLINDPFLYANFSERYATVFYTFLIYLKLLFFPATLTIDYYPYHIPLINWSDIRAIVPLVIYLFLGIYALIGFKKKSLISFALLFYFASFSVVSNLLFSIGVFMNERFLFISSLGFCLIIAYWFVVKIPQFISENKHLAYSKAVSFVIVTILILYSIRVFSRNNDWYDDRTLFAADVKTSHNSAFSSKTVGNHCIDDGIKPEFEKQRDTLLRQAIIELTRSTEIFPDFEKATFLLGNAHYLYNKNYDSAFFFYMRVLHQLPTFGEIYTNIPVMFQDFKDADYKIARYEDIFNFFPHNFVVCENLGALYLIDKKNYEKAIFYLENAIRIDDKKVGPYKNLGVAYFNNKKAETASIVFEEALKIAPNDAELYKNLSFVYNYLGNKEKANFYATKLKSLQN